MSKQPTQNQKPKIHQTEQEPLNKNLNHAPFLAFPNTGRTAMHWAAYGGQLGALQVLESHDGNLLLALDNDHSTALHLAAAHGDLGVVKWLVSGSSIFSTPKSHLTFFLRLLTVLVHHLSLSPLMDRRNFDRYHKTFASHINTF